MARTLRNRVTQNDVHALSILTLCAVNAWLLFQNTRWLLYTQPINRHVPDVAIYFRFDLILEIPGLLLGGAAAYLLVYRVGYSIWKIRYSLYRHELMTRALTVNSILLVSLTLAGLAQWIIMTGLVPLDLYGVISFGAIALVVSYAMEKRLLRIDHYTSGKILPFHFLTSLARVWAKTIQTAYVRRPGSKHYGTDPYARWPYHGDRYGGGRR